MPRQCPIGQHFGPFAPVPVAAEWIGGTPPYTHILPAGPHVNCTYCWTTLPVSMAKQMADTVLVQCSAFACDSFAEVLTGAAGLDELHRVGWGGTPGLPLCPTCTDQEGE
jgi:hypothetical protein